MDDKLDLDFLCSFNAAFYSCLAVNWLCIIMLDSPETFRKFLIPLFKALEIINFRHRSVRKSIINEELSTAVPPMYAYFISNQYINILFG